MSKLGYILAPIALISTAAAGEVEIYMDQARLYAVEQPIGQIIVANPAIADVAVHSNKELVLFGKMPGMTNLFVFGVNGEPLGSVSLRVATSRKNMVTVYAGAERMTMSCTTVCEHTYTVGDGIHGLNQGADIATQAMLRFDMASSFAAGSTSSSLARAATTKKTSDDDMPLDVGG